jgi:hypothetical protein
MTNGTLQTVANYTPHADWSPGGDLNQTPAAPTPLRTPLVTASRQPPRQRQAHSEISELKTPVGGADTMGTPVQLDLDTPPLASSQKEPWGGVMSSILHGGSILHGRGFGSMLGKSASTVDATGDARGSNMRSYSVKLAKDSKTGRLGLQFSHDKDCNKIVVSGIDADCAAHQEGHIKRGDHLLQINDWQLPDDVRLDTVRSRTCVCVCVCVCGGGGGTKR